MGSTIKRAYDSRLVEAVKLILGGLPCEEREAVERYYLMNQTPKEICQELNLTNPRFLEIRKNVRQKFDALTKSN